MHSRAFPILIAVLLSLVVLQQFAAADVIVPGSHQVSITNRITNMASLSNYVIISCDPNWLSMCPVSVISSNGVIPECYKFSNVSVYGISRQAYNSSITSMNGTNLKVYLAAHGQLLAEHIIQSIEVNDSAPSPSPIMEFALSIGNVVQPDYTSNTIAPVNPGSNQNGDTIASIYVIVSAAALSVLIYVLHLKRKKNA